MKGIDRRILKVVTGVHVALLAALMGYGLLGGCFRPKPDVVVPVEFLVDVRPRTEVAPPPVSDPVDTPEPEPEPEPVRSDPPEPPPRRQIQVNTNRVIRRVDPPAANPVSAQPNPLTQEQIRRLLAEGAQASDRTSIPTADQRGLAMIRKALYSIWQPPSKAVAGEAEAILTLQLGADGSVRQARVSRPSGNAALDTSVQRVAGQIRRIHHLPTGFVERWPQVTIAFAVE